MLPRPSPSPRAQWAVFRGVGGASAADLDQLATAQDGDGGLDRATGEAGAFGQLGVAQRNPALGPGGEDDHIDQEGRDPPVVADQVG